MVSLERLAPFVSQNLLHKTLLEAIRQNNHVLARVLLANGANCNHLDGQGRTYLMLCVNNNDESLCRILFQYNPNVNITLSDGTHALHYAAKNGNTNIIGMLLEKNCDINIMNVVRATPLTIACHFNQEATVRYLINAGAQMDTRSYSGYYPLHYAAIGNGYKAIKALLDSGANAEVVSFCNMTPLMMACRDASCHSVEALNSVSDLDRMDTLFGGTALHWAICSGCRHCVNCLLQCGSKLDMKDKSGRTPLIQAVISHKPEIIAQILFEMTKTETELSDVDKKALLVACSYSYRSRECVQKLLEYECFQEMLYHRDFFGDTAMSIAISRENVQAVGQLLQEGWNYKLDANLRPKLTRSMKYRLKIWGKRSKYDLLKLLALGWTLVKDMTRKKSTYGEVHQVFKTYSSLKMRMIHHLNHTNTICIIEPSAVDYTSWLDNGPDNFHLRVTDMSFMDWYKERNSNPESLKELCRGALRKNLGYRATQKIQHLPLPIELQKYLSLCELDEMKNCKIIYQYRNINTSQIVYQHPNAHDIGPDDSLSIPTFL